jgi:hypothetical protein
MLDPLIDVSRIKTASITSDARLGCWITCGNWRIFSLSIETSHLPSVTRRIYDLYSARQWNQSKGLSDNPRSRDFDKICNLS